MRHPWLLGVLGISAALVTAPSWAAEPAKGGPQVRLVAPGQPPLRALRYRTEVGRRGRVSMTMSTAMAMSLEGAKLMSMPAVEMKGWYDYRVTEVTPQGDVRQELEFGPMEVVERPDLPPGTLQAMREAVAGIEGLRGFSVSDARGMIRDADVTIPPSASPQLRQMFEGMRQSLRQISAPFPEEPVGVGARWDTTLEITQNGLTIEQLVHNELAALESDIGKVAITLVQKAKPQRVEAPNLPPGARVDLVSLASTGDGETHFDLTKPAPSSARVNMKMDMTSAIKMTEDTATVKVKAQEMKMNMEMSMTMTAGPQPVASPTPAKKEKK